MKFINSQNITENLTHLTDEKGYQGMKKNGIFIPSIGIHGLAYKPSGFWISIDGDWERWCRLEHFRNVPEETICDVYLKPNLTFIRIQSVYDADELMKFLLPDIKNEFPELSMGFTSMFDKKPPTSQRPIERLTIHDE